MSKYLKKVGKYLGYGILLVLMLFFSLSLLLRIPAVQQYVVNTITDYLSEELKTEVSIERVTLSFFDRLVFENFYVEDQGGEPLIVAKYLEANFNTGLFALLQKRLELNEITLRHAELNTKRKYGQLSDNLQFIIDYFEQRQRIRPAYKAPGKFIFNVKTLLLYDFSFNRLDELKGADIQTHIDRGIFHFKEVNIPYLTFDAKSIQIDAPQVSMRNFEPTQAGISFDSLLVVPTELLYPDSSFWKVRMERFDIKDGYFQFHNERIEPVKLTPDSILNYRHVEVFDIHALVNDFSFEEEVFQGSIRNLAFYDLSGFVLEPSYAERFLVSNKRAELLGLRLQTPHTSLGDTLIFKYTDYADFLNFPDQVEMRLNFKESHVRLDDIMTFAPALENNTFFDRNRRLRLNLDGQVAGSINDMKGENLNIQLEDGSRIRGSFTASKLTSPGQQKLNLQFQSLNTRIATLRRILPNFDLPKNFNKLGQLYYTGRFDMIWNDFILSGKLRSQLGDAVMDLQLNRSPRGLDDATYSGKLNLNDFDLQAWTENDDFGKITLSSKVEEGRGLTGKTADARLIADIESFEYRGYTYENAKINGRLNQRLFKGDLRLQDEHIALDFHGKLDYTQAKPLFDFDAYIERLHLKPLNLAKKDLQLEGRIDLRIENDKPAEMIGTAFIQDFKLRNPDYEDSIDSMRIRSDVDTRAIRSINIVSSLLDADITGDFDLMSLPNTLVAYLHRNLPNYAQRLKLQIPEGEIDSTSQFTTHFSIKNSKNFTKFFIPKLDTLKDIELISYFNNAQDELEIDLTLPQLTYDSMRIEETKLVAGFQQQKGVVDLAMQKIVLKNGRASEPLSLHTNIASQNLGFNLQYAPNINNLLSQLKLNGEVQLLDSVRTRLVLDMDDLSLLSSDWQLDASNFIEFRDKEVEVGNFLFNDKQGRSIRLNNIGNKGLNLLAKGFQLGIIDTFWNYPLLDFGGKFRLQASVGDIFEMNTIKLAVQADSFLINGDNYGNMTLDASAENLKSSLHPYISIIKDSMQLSVTGRYNLPNFVASKKASTAQENQPNYFNANLNVSKYPLAFLDYFLGHSISNTTGTINGKLSLKGFFPEPKISGYANVLHGATTIDFLQSRFYVHNQKAVIDDDCICADRGVVTDMNGNKAYVQGGITHQFLKNLGLDVRMTTANDQFVALNTKKGDNDVFYGRGMGSGTIWFSGPFSQTDIVINAIAGKGTKIVIPVSYDKSASENRFITFTDPNQVQTDTIIDNVTELRGVKMDMGLTLTDVAEIDLVFDEQAGDIIRGRGKGNVQIYLDRTQEMTMYGDYVIEEGEYLFTLQKIVNKPFNVRRGGTIKWTGDPFNANIDLQAEYKGLSTPVSGLIQEYLGFATEDIQTSARIPTDVDLLMHLRGQLLKPTIDFDISFPRLQGNLKTYAENKVRTLKQDQNALNRQVFGLIVLGQFIPSELTLAQSDDLAVNTMSEFLANQLSILLTDFFSDILDGNKVISSIDVDLTYNRFGDQANIQQGSPLTGEQYQFIGRANLLDDRWIVSVGPSIVSETGSTAALYGHDIVLEYFVNQDRTIKLRVSNVIEPTLGSPQQKTAAGISYEKEFDTFREFLRGIAQKDVRIESGE